VRKDRGRKGPVTGDLDGWEGRGDEETGKKDGDTKGW